MADAKRSLKWLGFSLVGLLIAGYALFGARRYLQGPVLAIDFPQENAVVEGPSVHVTGRGKNLSYFYINGSQAYLNQDGTFTFVYTPPRGDTILEATGKDRFGRVRQVVVRFSVTN